MKNDSTKISTSSIAEFVASLQESGISFDPSRVAVMSMKSMMEDESEFKVSVKSTKDFNAEMKDLLKGIATHDIAVVYAEDMTDAPVVDKAAEKKATKKLK